MQVTLAKGDIFDAPITLGGGPNEDLRTVVVRDAQGNAIFAAVQQDAETVWAITADSPRFHEIVEGLGITVRQVVDRRTPGGTA
jgi:hypothetical protein